MMATPVIATEQGQTQMKHFEHPQEQRNLEEPIRKAKEEAAKVTSRTEVLQSLLTLLYSLLTLLHSAAEPQRQASQGFDDRQAGKTYYMELGCTSLHNSARHSSTAR